MSEPTYAATLVCDEPLMASAKAILVDLHISFLPFAVGYDLEDLTQIQHQGLVERLSEVAGPMGHSWSLTLG
jgi:hypothetical protein